MTGPPPERPHHDTPDGTPPPPPLDGVVNFREMGGLPAADGGTVRTGRLFRSGHWSQATPGDVEVLGRYDLAAIIDFRTDLDRAGDGGQNRIPTGPDYHRLEMVDTDGGGQSLRATLLSGDQALLDARFGNGQAEALAGQFVLDLALEPGKQQVFSRFVQIIAETDGRPVLWHCSAGKDRAGWAATVIGMILGVPDDALVAHYVASNVHRPVGDRLAHYAERGLDASVVRPFLLVDETYLRAGLAAVDERWPSRERYLIEALGLTARRIERLRETLIA